MGGRFNKFDKRDSFDSTTKWRIKMSRFRESKRIISLGIVSMLMLTAGCSTKTEVSEVETTPVEQTAEVAVEEKDSKPFLELESLIALSDVKEDLIPDVTSEKWSLGIASSKPIVDPNGEYVIAVEHEKMARYNIGSNEKVWEVPVYGGIYSYVIEGDKLFMSEKYAYKKTKEDGHVICLDANTGEEIWKYNVQEDMAKVVAKYKPEDADFKVFCNIQMTNADGLLYILGSTSWVKEKVNDKTEVLMCLDMDGNKMWETQSHGLPGMLSMSAMNVIDGVLVMGNYSYGDAVNGPASVNAFDIKNGETAWKYEIANDAEMSYNGKTSLSVGVVDGKIVAIAAFGKAYVLDTQGNLINEFVLFEPEKYEDVMLCTSVSRSSTGFGDGEIIVAPKKTTVKGSSSYNSESPAQHSAVGLVKVFDLEGNVKWNFRLGGSVTNMKLEGDYLVLATSHNQDTMDYDYCGVYVFDISQDGSAEEVNVQDESALEKYVGSYQTEGAILYNSVDVSADGSTIIAMTWPTRVDVEKHGNHEMYILDIN